MRYSRPVGFAIVTQVLVLGKIDQAGVDLLRDGHGYNVVELPDHAPELPAHIANVDAIVVRMTRIDAALIGAAPALSIVARHGVGYEAVDVAALTRRRIPLALVGDVNSRAVAEHTLALMLAIAKRIVLHDRAMRNGNFGIRDDFAATELAEKAVLVIGLGRIGRAVARRCAAFDMSVYAFDPYVEHSEIRSLGYSPCENLDSAIAAADFVCVHVPKNAATRHLIGAEQIARMKESAAILNVSRGGIVDETALCAALERRALGGAALDVFEPEPPSKDSPLLALDSLVLSPHCAAFTQECGRRMALACARNVVAAVNGSLDPALVVNSEVLRPG